MQYANEIARILSLSDKVISKTLDLLNEGNTIPFIARYRKEATNGLTEVDLINIQNQYNTLKELESRREFILKAIKEQDKLSPEVEKAITAAKSLSTLEDIYLPFKPKRKTKASVAREKGLEPLAKVILEDQQKSPVDFAARYISEEQGVNSIEEALEGAMHIVAEWISENPKVRERLRNLFIKTSVLSSKVI